MNNKNEKPTLVPASLDLLQEMEQIQIKGGNALMDAWAIYGNKCSVVYTYCDGAHCVATCFPTQADGSCTPPPTEGE